MQAVQAIYLVQQATVNAMRFATLACMGLPDDKMILAGKTAAACDRLFYELTGDHATLEQLKAMMSDSVDVL